MLELRGITWDHPRGLAPLAASSGPYADRAGVCVRWSARSLKDFGDAPFDALAREFDLLIIDHPHVGLAAQQNCLTPLDELLDPEVIDGLDVESAGPSHASYRLEGAQWALAVDAAMQASASRPDLFREHALADWEQVIASGRRVRAAGRYFAIPLAPTDAICSFLSLCAGFGTPAAEGDAFVRGDVGERALATLRRLHELSPPDCVNWNPIRTLDELSTRDEIVHVPLSFCYTNYSRAGFRPRRVVFHDIPGLHGSVLGGAGIAVSALRPERAAAAAYAAWICSADVQRTLYVENGGQPGNVAAWLDGRANELTGGFFRDTFDTIKHAWVRPREPWWPGFQEAAGNVLNLWLRERGEEGACLRRLEALYAERQAGWPGDRREPR